jgi:hypothetical protein
VIECVQHTQTSYKGEPIVLGRLVVPQELVSLAKGATRIELVRAFRQKYGLPIDQASKAAGELIEVLAINCVS